MLGQLLQSRNERKLGEAIAAHDLGKMEALLGKGIRRVNYLLMRPGDFGDGSVQVPAGKFEDPVSLARQVGLRQDGLALLARYGVGEPQPVPASVRPR